MTPDAYDKGASALWNDPRWLHYHSKDPASARGLLDEFDDWVGWLRSITLSFKEPFMILPSPPLLGPGEEPDEDFPDTPPLVKDEDRWQDDGGESAESI